MRERFFGILVLVSVCGTFIGCDTKNTTGLGPNSPTNPNSNPVTFPTGQNPANAVYGNECGQVPQSNNPNLEPHHSEKITIHGKSPWYPHFSFGYDGMASYFATDDRLQFRIRVEPDPKKLGCHLGVHDIGTVISQTAGMRAYRVLKLNVHARYFNGQKFNSNSFRTYNIGPISVGKCSQVYDVPIQGGGNNGLLYLTIDDVRSDSACDHGGYYPGSYAQPDYCPSEVLVRVSDCWSVTLEFSTSLMQPLK